MHFAREYNLLFILLVPVVAVFFVLAFRWKRKMLETFGHLPLMQKLTAEVLWSNQRWKAVLIVLVLFFLVFVMSGPQIGAKLVNVKRRGVNIIVAVDTSRSMNAEDIKPDRLTKAKQELTGLLNKIQGDRVGIIAFAGSAFLQCPLTLDVGAAKMFLDMINTDLVPKPGTAIGSAINLATETFPRQERKYKVLILLTDGEDLASNPLDAAEQARKEGVVIYTIGIGSLEGELIPVRGDANQVKEYKKDKDGKVVMSRLDEVLLMKIALTTGGKYYRSSGGEIEVDGIYEEISSMEKKEMQSKLFSQYEDRFQWFLLVAFILMAIELFLPERKKITLFVLILGMMLFPGHSDASIAGKVNTGNRYFKQQKYDEALEKYRDAQIDDPESGQVHFNIGDALYRKEKYDEAMQEFNSATNSRDVALQSKAYYNIGNCQFRLGNFADAILYYKKALEMNPKDEDAKYNIELARKKLKEEIDKQKNKKDQKQEQKQQNKQGQNNKKDEKKKSERQAEQKKEGQRQETPEQKQEKKKGEMSKEEAMRILNAMDDQEKETQKKRMKTMTQEYQVEKDW